MSLTQDKIKQITDLPIFFIIGRPRTGTTLLRILFDGHPRVAIPPECPLIMSLYAKYKKVKNWTEKDLLSVYNDLFQLRFIDNWQIDREKLKNDLLSCKGNIPFQTIIKIIHLNSISYFDKQEIALVGDKNPIYSIYVKNLVKLFPEAKFIHLVRDYRDNLVSIRNTNFEADIAPLVAYRWCFAIRLMDKLKKKKTENFYTIRYEDFVADPKNHLPKLCKFLGIEYDPSVLEYHSRAEVVAKTIPPEILKIHKSLLKPVNTSRTKVWEKEIPDREVKLMDAVAGKLAEKYGYERKFPHPGLWIQMKVIPAKIYGFCIYRLMIAGASLPAGIGKFTLEKLTILIRFYLKYFKKKKGNQVINGL